MADLDTTPNDTQGSNAAGLCLPAFARSSLNRCNLPAIILGSLTYQQHPMPLLIDGVRELHGEFFQTLGTITSAPERALHFRQYMCSAFLLGQSEQAGSMNDNRGIRRDKADYLRLLRGWMFSPDSIEAAVLKRWVESRFGLLTLNHGGPLDSPDSPAYLRYQADYVRGLYNSNALESQLDLLYSYCQYELQRQWPACDHWLLYRGINQLQQHFQPQELQPENGSTDERVLLLNNLNAFSNNGDTSDSFGDVVLQARIPSTKLLYFPELLPGVLNGEGEYLVIGGLCRAALLR